MNWEVPKVIQMTILLVFNDSNLTQPISYQSWNKLMRKNSRNDNYPFSLQLPYVFSHFIIYLGILKKVLFIYYIFRFFVLSNRNGG